jgi:hypothetical protein
MNSAYHWMRIFEEHKFNGKSPKDAAKELVKEVRACGIDINSILEHADFNLDEKDIDTIRQANRFRKKDGIVRPLPRPVKDWYNLPFETEHPQPTKLDDKPASRIKTSGTEAVLAFQYCHGPSVLSILRATNLPIRYVIQEACDEPELILAIVKVGGDFYESIKTIFSLFPEDSYGHNVSPDIYDQCQEIDKSITFDLIATDIGAASWEEWLKWYDAQELVYEDEGDLTFDALDSFDLSSGEDVLLGNGLLCAGEAIGLYGSSGIGKSVLVKQWAICASAGVDFFRIPTAKPCKVLVFQGENSKRAEAEAVQGIRAAFTKWSKLTPEHVELVRKNFVVVPAVGVSGNKFMGLLRRKIQRHKPDLVFIDPLLAVSDGNLSSQEYMSDLLRENIIPMAKEFGVGIVVVHHSGKNGDGLKERTIEDVKNGALGSMDFAASLRAVIGLFPKTSDGKTYEIVTTKRGGQYLGRKDSDGNVIDSDRFNIRHSQDGVVWIAMDKIAETANTQELELDSTIPKVEEFIRSQGSVKVADLQKFAKEQRPPILTLAIEAANKLVETKPQEFHHYKLVATGLPSVWSTAPEPEENRKKREAKAKK